MRTLYPEIEPYRQFFLAADGRHSIYVELSGNPCGLPVIFLHGGPCSGTKPDHRRFFDPERYLIILFDQRGCGQSLPFGELDHNNTAALVDDIERIRRRLGIGRWLVFGGSWGATLALLYAQQHPSAVAGLVLRAVFLARQQDLDWFGGSGAGRIYPEAWRQVAQALPAGHDGQFVDGLWQVVAGEDEAARRRAARAWLLWQAQVALGPLFDARAVDGQMDGRRIKQAQMELHYARHRYFVAENQVLAHCGRLRDIPTVIIHGRQDLLCPLEAGMALHEALPEATFAVLPTAGHIAQHPEMADALVTATDAFADRLAQAGHG